MVGYNNNGISNSQSAVDFVAPPYAGNYGYTHTAGVQYTPASYSARHACNGHNNNMGNSQSLPNGNLLVCIAQSGTIYEVNAAGTQLWTYSGSGTIAQAFRYDECYLTTARPAVPTISANGNVLTSSSADSYQWYLNGVIIQGATSQSYSPTQDGIYLVKVGEINGCQFNYSVGYRYSTILSAENTTEADQLTIYPNPANNRVCISGLQAGQNVLLELFNMTGQRIYQQQNSNSFDVSTYPEGIYFLRISINGTSTHTHKLVLSH
jgi:hypothetical protein